MTLYRAGLLNDEPAKKCNGLINDSAIKQSTVGAALQWSWKAQFAGLHHQIVVGGLVESSHLQFAQSSQLGYLNPDRSVIGFNPASPVRRASTSSKKIIATSKIS